MKVLWLTTSPSLYSSNSTDYNGRGWIESLEKYVSQNSEINLAVGFFHRDSIFKKRIGKVIYYPISIYSNFFKKLQLFFNPNNQKDEIKSCLKIIDDFEPDIIHVFGTEPSFGLLSTHINIPVIVHIQGILIPCKNAYYPPGISLYDFLISNVFKPIYLSKLISGISSFNYKTNRERDILAQTKYFMGRTNWDKSISQLFSKKSKYFYCSELLRDQFYLSKKWSKKSNSKIILTSTISKTPYKGLDLILKTARILKEYSDLDFVWNVIGVDNYSDIERIISIKSVDVNVNLIGIKSADEILDILLNSNIYVHPSYIDNSPNSLCEAQIIGVPSIATNVGGVSSLIENNFNGLLVPSNDPFTLAHKIIELSGNVKSQLRLSENSIKTALKRHDRQRVYEQLLFAYSEIK